jgi:hypothetical protein
VTLSFAAQRRTREVQRWVGAWCAVATVLLVACWISQTHRSIWTTARLPVPEEARVSPAALAAWLRCTEHEPFRPQVERPAPSIAGWHLIGGSAWVRYDAHYVSGEDSMILHTEPLGFLTGLSRLDEGVDIGLTVIALAGSLELGLALLAASGLLLWAQGRGAGHRWTMIGG